MGGKAPCLMPAFVSQQLASYVNAQHKVHIVHGAENVAAELPQNEVQLCEMQGLPAFDTRPG